VVTQGFELQVITLHHFMLNCTVNYVLQCIVLTCGRSYICTLPWPVTWRIIAVLL